MKLIRPYENVLPPLTTAERRALEMSIATEGVREPCLATEDGRLLDGHNRLDIDPRAPVRIVPDSADWSDEECRAFISRTNDERRNMSPAQKAERREQNKADARALRERDPVRFTQEALAQLYGVVRSVISDWTSNGEADISIVGTDNAYIPDARVSVPKAEYERIAGRIDAGESQAHVAADYGITQPRVSQIVDIVEAARRPAQVVGIPPEFPQKHYRCLVIDPPWPVKKIERQQRPHQGDKLDYAVQSVEEIRDFLPIATLADPRGCHVYLWVTQKHLPDGLKFFEAWGVAYQCVLTWVKPTGITPYSWMYNTEHVLFGRIGSLDIVRKGLKLSFEAPVTRHSDKPDSFFQLARQASPEPRLSLYERRERAGFEVWGHEAPHE